MVPRNMQNNNKEYNSKNPSSSSTTTYHRPNSNQPTYHEYINNTSYIHASPPFDPHNGLLVTPHQYNEYPQQHYNKQLNATTPSSTSSSSSHRNPTPPQLTPHLVQQNHQQLEQNHPFIQHLRHFEMEQQHSSYLSHLKQTHPRMRRRTAIPTMELSPQELEHLRNMKPENESPPSNDTDPNKDSKRLVDVMEQFHHMSLSKQ